MVASVVTVGRHRYAVGLYWENSPGGGRVGQIAKEAARQPGQQADFYAVRPGNKDGRVPQFGLCSNEAGQVRGMPVLAGCLAGQIPGSWAGAFRLNEGIAVVIVRDELIVPDGDLFFREETEARDRLLQEVGFGGLQTIYAPESWSIPGADAIPLSLLLNDQKDIQLQRVTIPTKVKIIAGALIGLFVIVVGVFWYMQEKEAEELAHAEQLRLDTMRAQQLNHLSMFNQQEPPKPVYDRVWEKKPPALSVIDVCAKELARVPSALSGWKLVSLKCSDSSIFITWARDKGSTTPPPGSAVNESGTGATQTLSYPPLTPRGPETLADIADNTNRYLLQTWPGPISRAADDPPPPPPPGYTGPWSPPPAPWVKRSFTLTVPELPSGLPVYFGDLPGVIVNSLSFTPGAVFGMWVVEGVIYENRK